VIQQQTLTTGMENMQTKSKGMHYKPLKQSYMHVNVCICHILSIESKCTS